MPSLNKDFPTIFVFRLLEVPAVFMIPMTAMGSEGAIKEPNKRQ